MNKKFFLILSLSACIHSGCIGELSACYNDPNNANVIDVCCNKKCGAGIECAFGRIVVAPEACACYFNCMLGNE